MGQVQATNININKNLKQNIVIPEHSGVKYIVIAVDRSKPCAFFSLVPTYRAIQKRELASVCNKK